MSWLISFLSALLKLLLPAIVDAVGRRATPTAEDSASSPLKDSLRSKVLATWGKKGAVLLLLFFLSLSGCAARTVYVKDGEPVRLRETIRGAKVWVLDKDGTPTASELDLPEGWYALPVPEAGK